MDASAVADLEIAEAARRQRAHDLFRLRYPALSAILAALADEGASRSAILASLAGLAMPSAYRAMIEGEIDYQMAARALAAPVDLES